MGPGDTFHSLEREAGADEKVVVYWSMFRYRVWLFAVTRAKGRQGALNLTVSRPLIGQLSFSLFFVFNW